jgi:molybdenum cofactor cytidylyltransferase
MISCILLAAGLSSRFGSPKALAPIANSPAIVFLLKKLCASRIDEIIIVLGADQDAIEPHLFKHKLIRIVHNNDYKFGQTSSVQTGLKSISAEAEAFMTLPVDCPFVQTRTIDKLINQFTKTHPRILIPAFNSQKGHPPLFHISLKEDILKLKPAQGLNEIIHNPTHQTEILDLPDMGIVQTFNTPDELARILNSTDFKIT